MSEQRPALSLRYYLNLEEVPGWFCFSDLLVKDLYPFFNPLISIAIIVWGIYLGFRGGVTTLHWGLFPDHAGADALLVAADVV